ncbi:MAG: hypothetical protein JW891_13575 [Candidatus Lokiarchaeota archaeon]|nr:hypothetical protein [Candidatus Lokiarchaeota archaeon]
MTKEKYACRECGFVFPVELGEMIENKIQVFCEKCGSAYTMKGVVFKPYSETQEQEKPLDKSPKLPPLRTTYYNSLTQKTSQNKLKNISKIIKGIDTIVLPFMVFIPIILISMSAFEVAGYFLQINTYINYYALISNAIFVFASVLIIYYYKKYISKQIKNEKFDEITVDAFCLGILGSIFFGLGVPLLVEGVFVLLHNLIKRTNFPHNLKDSLNRLSLKGGVIIIFIAFAFLIRQIYYISFTNGLSIYIVIESYPYFSILPIEYLISVGIFLVIAIASLIIDSGFRKSIARMEKIEFGTFLRTIILGVLVTMFFAAGIFILLKAVLLFLMFIIQPKKIVEETKTIQEEIKSVPEEKVPSEKIDRLPDIIEEKEIKSIKEEEIFSLTKRQKKELKEHVDKSKKLKDEIKKEPSPDKKYELKIHESLLPVSDDKDKELVKHYFSKIFAVLSKEAKEQINKLKISKKEKKELLEELAFLTQEEQVKYLETIVSAYQEIPKKLTDRIRKLPNIKTTHLDKIVDQLKYLDYEEQLKFVQYLEENA